MNHHYVKIIGQGLGFINALTDEQFTSSPGNGASPVGKHFRHILDHFTCIIDGYKDGVINYENRRRGSNLESNRLSAIVEFERVQAWLASLSATEAGKTVTVICDVGVGETAIASVPSSVGRELMFATSHATHHYALIKNLVKGVATEAHFGIAPSTVNNDASLQAQ